MAKPIPQTLLERVRYDPDARFGLVWVKPRWEKWVDKPTGSVIRDTEGHSHLAHRVVWALHHGDPGDFQIDHADRDHSNNRIENLRLATPAQNQQNRVRFGRPGYKGVKKHQRSERWIATCNGQYLGSFASPELAALAYNEAALRTHGEYAVLNDME